MEELVNGSSHSAHHSFLAITHCHTSLHYLFNITLLPPMHHSPLSLSPLSILVTTHFPSSTTTTYKPSWWFCISFSSQFFPMYNQKLKAPQTLAIQLIKRNNNTLMVIFQDRCFIFKLKYMQPYFSTNQNYGKVVWNVGSIPTQSLIPYNFPFKLHFLSKHNFKLTNYVVIQLIQQTILEGVMSYTNLHPNSSWWCQQDLTISWFQDFGNHVDNMFKKQLPYVIIDFIIKEYHFNL
jgi:hypothetical protein